MPKINKKCRNCRFFVFQIHHDSYCELSIKKGSDQLRDGRTAACENWKK